MLDVLIELNMIELWKVGKHKEKSKRMNQELVMRLKYEHIN